MKKAVLLLATGFEEIEAVTICDVLRRGQIEVSMASIGEPSVVGAHGIQLQADSLMAEVQGELFDAVILPGGMVGTENLLASAEVTTFLQHHAEAGRLVSAICAAPWVLYKAKLLQDKQATIYPGLEEKISGSSGDDSVVQDGNIITSKGPATAMEFSLALLRELAGEQVASEVGRGLLFYP